MRKSLIDPILLELVNQFDDGRITARHLQRFIENPEIVLEKDEELFQGKGFTEKLICLLPKDEQSYHSLILDADGKPMYVRNDEWQSQVVWGKEDVGEPFEKISQLMFSAGRPLFVGRRSGVDYVIDGEEEILSHPSVVYIELIDGKIVIVTRDDKSSGGYQFVIDGTKIPMKLRPMCQPHPHWCMQVAIYKGKPLYIGLGRSKSKKRADDFETDAGEFLVHGDEILSGPFVMIRYFGVFEDQLHYSAVEELEDDLRYECYYEEGVKFKDGHSRRNHRRVNGAYAFIEQRHAKTYLVMDGVERLIPYTHGLWGSFPILANGQLLYAAPGANNHQRGVRVIWGERKSSLRDEVHSVAFVDGAPLYVARCGRTWSIVWGDRSFGAYDEIDAPRVETKSVTAVVRKGRRVLNVRTAR